MQHIKRFFLELAYNGTSFHGWQSQPNAVAVQEVLEQALQKVFRRKVETLGCGRTDTAVHASQFFVHFDLPADLNFVAEKFLKSVNALLPTSIAVYRVIPVHADAHARFDATQRSYEYHIHYQKNPFKHNLSWQITGGLNLEAMQDAATIIKNYNDFGAFCKANADNFTNICNIYRSEWEETTDGLIYHISANRFLRNMVRAIVGTLVDVGRGKLGAKDMHGIIQSQNRSAAGASVPACGLFLTQIHYPYI